MCNHQGLNSDSALHDGDSETTKNATSRTIPDVAFLVVQALNALFAMATEAEAAQHES